MTLSCCLFVTGVRVVLERHQHAVYRWFAGGYSRRTLELTQADCAEGPAVSRRSTCSVRLR